MNTKETLIYWIRERENVRRLKEKIFPRPWSQDQVFQHTYFCNVRREDDKTTRWIRSYYSSWVNNPMFCYNIIFSRFINNYETLNKIGYLTEHNPQRLVERLEELALKGKVWGGAYIITTHGLRMGKAAYLAQNVLQGAFDALDSLDFNVRYPRPAPNCLGAYQALRKLEGLGSFLAAQVVADLKNTFGHPLEKASDWNTFVAEGPGSIRGVNWFHRQDPTKAGSKGWLWDFMQVRDYVDEHWPEEVAPICNQDLQNCLCEYDKYMRVSEGIGRSKRNYHGAA